jgi:hypothetical protein
MHTKLRWQQVLKIVLEDGISRHADHLGPETTCGSFLVLDFDIGGFGSPVSAIQTASTNSGIWHRPENQRVLISSFRRVLNVLCFLLGNSPASEFYIPTFRNTLSLPSSLASRYSSYLAAYEYGTDRVFRNVGT